MGPLFLAGCSALAQTTYLTRHNAAFKILFFELLRDHGLVETVPPWYSPTQPKPIYEGDRVTAYWDICSSFCRPDGSQGQQDRRSDSEQGAQDGNTTGDELPMGRQSGPQRRGEDHEVPSPEI